MIYRGKGGKQYNLENSPFAQGGEGQVFNIKGQSDIVAKLYKDGKGKADRQKESKLLVMVDHIPAKETLNQIAWPMDVLYDSSNTFVGFVMPKLALNEDLNVIYDYGSTAKYPNIPWHNKITIAKNLCVAIEAVHLAGHTIGDFNPKNININPQTGHVILVDTDSYHISDGGNVYRCNVGMPEYLPQEIQIKMKGGLATCPLPTFTFDTDNFALAVHIFQLLMNGVHPFACRVLPSQASVVFPQPIDNIVNGIFPFIQPAPGTSIPVFAPPISILPDEMQNLFKLAFIDGHLDPQKRPTPSAWYHALTRLESNLKTCNTVSHHEYFNGLSQCPWCKADNQFNNGLSTVSTLTQSTIPLPPNATVAPNYSYNHSKPQKANKPAKEKNFSWAVFLVLLFTFAPGAIFYLLYSIVPGWGKIIVVGIGILFMLAVVFFIICSILGIHF